MKKYILFFPLFFFFFSAFAQENTNSGLHGVVLEKTDEGERPLIGATLRWLRAKNGTTTDAEGHFHLQEIPKNDKLIVSFVGFRPDTLSGAQLQGELKIILSPNTLLKSVEVEARREASYRDMQATQNTEVMTEESLQKAACCNLAESFETNASVNAALTDAVTATRKIEMLGLAGIYSQLTLENMPGLRGIGAGNSLEYIPGFWISSVQISKGAGSVVNDYEAMTGQINIELFKPSPKHRLRLNGYVNQGGRTEANAIWTGPVTANKKITSALFLHGSTRPIEQDVNNDGFLDFPTNRQVNVLNRWVFNSGEGVMGQFVVHAYDDKRLGGQTGFEKDNPNSGFGAESHLQSVRLRAKNGYVLSPYQSIGIQVEGLFQRQAHDFGQRNLNSRQNSLYANFIYETILGNTNHGLRIGTSYRQEFTDENLDNFQLLREEYIPGVFGEYSYKGSEKWGVVAGLRTDYHNTYGLQILPRLQVRLNPEENTSLRASVSRGWRVANFLSENYQLLASNRAFSWENQQENRYQAEPEQAWSFGANLFKNLEFGNQSLAFSVDAYYVHFTEQVIVDRDASAQEVQFTQLAGGRSYSASVQAGVDYSPSERLEFHAAYRWQDVRSQYGGALLQQPFTPKHRAFVNAAYFLPESSALGKWDFDATLQWIGSQRLPSTFTNPEAYQLRSESPDFFSLNAQITKTFGALDVYVGGENLLNFRQSNPILSADNVNSPYFDATMVWGPIFGRMIYGGFRWTLE